MTRLDPPYLSAICLTLVLAYAEPHLSMFHGSAPHFTVSQIAYHFAYLNSLVNKPWLSPVFWTLGIEFQYYLLIGLIFPLLVSARPVIRTISMAAIVVPGLIVTRGALLFVHLPIFLMGILTFQLRSKRISNRWYFASLAYAALAASLTSGKEAIALGVVTALAVAFVVIRSRILGWLGTISYSLYLLHVPIGGRIMNLGARFAHHWWSQVAVLMAATSISVLAAYIMYRCIELPSQRLSARLSYKSRNRRESPQLAPRAIAVAAD
jgi:peptidoglycan/LPS O-acetylase OafA/YrhL